MNALLKKYCVSGDFPDVSGAEHLEMLQIRDEIALIELQLTAEEKKSLAGADEKFRNNALIFHQELSRFIDLKSWRKTEGIPPQRWWWFLDMFAWQSPSLLNPATPKSLPKTKIYSSSLLQKAG